MDLSKSKDFFDPTKITEEINIIGCGSIGSVLAELLVRTGIKTTINLFDFDIVEPHNMTNQLFYSEDIGRLKVEAVRDNMIRINPDLKRYINIYSKGWDGEMLKGYIFLAADSMKVRNKIAKDNKYNPYILFMCDFRTRLTDAQHYAANWKNEEQKDTFIASMDFSDSEALEATPTSACGTTLSVAPTIRDIVGKGVANWMNFIIDNNKIKNVILSDAFSFVVDTF